MARDKELEAERAKTRELERLLRVAEAEFRARPGNENVVLPCCICGQTTHSSADCRRYHFLEREARPPPQRERWVEVADPGSGEKPRLVTAAASGVSKRRPRKAGGRLGGQGFPAKPFKLSPNTVNAIAVLRRIFSSDQLTRPGKSGSPEKAPREGEAAGPTVILASGATAGGTLSKTTVSIAQPRGRASTLASTARTAEVGADAAGCGAGKADEPGDTEASPPSAAAIGAAAIGQTAANFRFGALKPRPDHNRAYTNRLRLADATAHDCPGTAEERRNIEAPPLHYTATGAEAARQTADDYWVSAKSLLYHGRAGPNRLLGAEATAYVCAGKTPAGTAAGCSTRTQAAAAALRDPDAQAIQLPSRQTCARPHAYPPGLTGSDKSLSGTQGNVRGLPDELLVASKCRHSTAASNVFEPRLASVVSQRAEVVTRVDGRVAKGNLASVGGDNGKRGQGKVSAFMLLVMRVALALGAFLTGGRGGSPGTCANTDTEHRKWCINQAEDCHLEAAPD